ncbi:MAG: hypothetical protein EOO52_08480 [Gammaproteobacteria bacterium]|nr:MAG: hypothetical protein EOO52_08480 [Gammaproteobacteria bacterium]
MPKKIAGETVLLEPSSREGTIYITAKYVYKIFGGRTNPYDELLKYKTAEARGVPLPATAKFTAQLQDGTNVQNVGGLRYSKIQGVFFQFSKGGGEKALINEINKMVNRELLKTLIAGLESAAAIGVTDPQGFISFNSNPPLTFIDLHYRGTPNIVSFQDSITAAESRLQVLG